MFNKLKQFISKQTSGIRVLLPSNRRAVQERFPSLLKSGLGFGFRGQFGGIPRGRSFSLANGGIPLAGHLEDIRSRRQVPDPKKEGGHLGSVIFRWSRQAIEFLTKSCLLAERDCRGGDGIILVQKVS